MTALKRSLVRLQGPGPRRLAPFAEIARDRASDAAGVHRTEDFSGVLTTVAGEPTFYAPPRGLQDETAAFEQLAERPRYVATGLAPADDKRLMALTDAGVITPDAIVYCRQTKRAVTETVRQWTAPAEQHPIFRAPKYPGAARTLGRCLSIGTLSGDGFYHFLLESLPRLQLARPWLERIDHVLVNGQPGSFHERWLAHAGVLREKLVWLEGLCHFACEQVLFTDYPMRDQQPGPWNVAAIRAAFPAPRLAPRARRLWISRADARVRQVGWEAPMLAQLPGFERVVLSLLSPEEQIRLFTEADAIVAPHGAGLANLVFCRPGAKVVELFPAKPIQPLYARLAQVSGVSHAWSVADFAAPAPPAGLAEGIRNFFSL